MQGRTISSYYTEELQKQSDETQTVTFEIHKYPSYPALKDKIAELPWDKYPIVIAGGSFQSTNASTKVSEEDKALLQALLDELDPEKVFFVVGHKLLGHEKYIVQNNKRFDIYSIVPSLMTQKQIQKINNVNHQRSTCPLHQMRSAAESNSLQKHQHIRESRTQGQGP